MDDTPVYTATPRVVTTQVAIATALGLSAVLMFSVLRYRWPHLYAPRSLQRPNLPDLGNTMFGWLAVLYRITDDQILEHAGLDAYVFLGFFKVAIQLLTICTACAVIIIGPIRLYFTGKYDQDGDYSNWIMLATRVYDDSPIRTGCEVDQDGPPAEGYMAYLWVYVIFTYVFTALTCYYMMKQTRRVVRLRQRYLGRQNAITDRTVRIHGIPHSLRRESALKQHIDTLGIGEVRNISLCRDWHQLDTLFRRRKVIITTLEHAWCEYLGQTWDHVSGMPRRLETPASSPRSSVRSTEGSESEPTSITPLRTSAQPPYRTLSGAEHIALLPQPTRASLQLGVRGHTFQRPFRRLGFLGLMGPKIDIIDECTHELELLDAQITSIREDGDFKPTGTAFVTMDSVASAQMTAQAILDPRPHKLLTSPAPAPHDVIWSHLYMTTRERHFRSYTVTFIIAVSSVAMLAPVSYLASFLDMNTIEKFWPGLAELLRDSEWARALVTGILPTFIYTLFNFTMPYLFLYLSSLQGFVSHGEEELSVISKNFFYVFFNMFLVLTIARAATSYWTFLKDTTQIACELAHSLREFSLFYVNLIILQGIGMFPFRMVQIGNVMRFPLFAARCKTPRDYRNLYKPPVFNHGIHLPQPILILIIVLLYSVISSKILFFGTIYFTIGYFTYKYQLMYGMVHIQHSTGQAWPLIFRRVCFGLILFHLAMGGILILQKGWTLTGALAPLPLLTIGYWYNFELSYVPLLHFIALEAIETSGSAVGSSSDSETDLLPLSHRRRRPSRTIDEQRELHQKYLNPNLVRDLDGPWIGVEGEEVIYANPEGTMRKRMRLEEWDD